MARKSGSNTQRYARPPRARSKTRSNKPRLIDGSDPLQEEKLLKAQLSNSGLYLANTLGDGNCLFRALSDQLTGNEASHSLIRHQVCEYLAQNAERYSPYVDSDAVPGGYQGHVASMRQLGTYGTDIELTAFSHLFKRSVKVFQPGLVYVIQAEDSPTTSTKNTSPSTSPASSIASTSQETLDMDEHDEGRMSPRERRLLDRKAKKEAANKDHMSGNDKGKRKCAPTEERRRKAIGSLYIAYHSWEHYSSVRRIQGPHTGPPNIDQVEQGDQVSATTTLPPDATPDPSAPREPTPPSTRARARLRDKRQEKKRSRASTLTQQSLKNQQYLASSVALPDSSNDVSPADSSPFDSADSSRATSNVQQAGVVINNPKHRGRSMSMSSSTSTQHARQRSRRQSPASAGSTETTIDSPASSFDLHHVDLLVQDDNGSKVENEGADFEVDTEDTCSSADPIDLIASSTSSSSSAALVHGNKSILQNKYSKGQGAGGKRDMTAREKKELARKKRMETRRLKGNQQQASNGAVTAAAFGVKEGGDGLHLHVKELFI
ncbi:hypothetical protein ACM66B_006871 [Microbotryomycetes sp. NB124-2]